MGYYEILINGEFVKKFKGINLFEIIYSFKKVYLLIIYYLLCCLCV